LSFRFPALCRRGEGSERRAVGGVRVRVRVRVRARARALALARARARGIAGRARRSSGFPARDLSSAPGMSGDCRKALAGVAVFGVRWADMSRDREGAEWTSLSRNLVITLSVLSTFYFLESPFYGRDAIAPSPPTPLPRFKGARGGVSGQWREERVFGCSSGFPARALCW